jgi:hypothetical protein
VDRLGLAVVSRGYFFFEGNGKGEHLNAAKQNDKQHAKSFGQCRHPIPPSCENFIYIDFTIKDSAVSNHGSKKSPENFEGLSIRGDRKNQ